MCDGANFHKYSLMY